MVRYRVTHRTTYVYESVVSSSYGEAHLVPRALPRQTRLWSEVRIDPDPADRRDRVDHFGNDTLYFSLLRPHTQLSVTATSEVEVHTEPPAIEQLPDEPWEAARQRLHERPTANDIESRQFVLDSPHVTTSAELRDYALGSFAPGRPIAEAMRHLSSRIHDEFVFDPGTTSVTTTLEEVLAHRRGVCQDFAHLAIGCVRSLGLPARYVSGYLETDAPPGSPKLQGADASHAWASVYVPGAGWIDVDPTNDTVVAERHITTAWGRDYSDVPPLKGVIFTEGATRELTVEVDVVAI